MPALPDMLDRRAVTVRCGSLAGACDTGELLRKVEAPCPRLPAFNGKTLPQRPLAELFGIAASDYRLQAQTVGPTQTFALPSTSGATRRWRSIQPWRHLAELRRNGPVG